MELAWEKFHSILNCGTVSSIVYRHESGCSFGCVVGADILNVTIGGLDPASSLTLTVSAFTVFDGVFRTTDNLVIEGGTVPEPLES